MHYNELKNTIVTTLVNTHPSIGVVRPLLPNTVEIGGYHIKGPEELPDVIHIRIICFKCVLIYYYFIGHQANFRFVERRGNILQHGQ